MRSDNSYESRLQVLPNIARQLGVVTEGCLYEIAALSERVILIPLLEVSIWYLVLIVGGILFIKLLDDLYCFLHSSATFACNSLLGTLQQAFGTQPLNLQQSDHDLLCTAHDLLASIPHLQLRHCHVHGHQDDTTPFQPQSGPLAGPSGMCSQTLLQKTTA